MNKKYFETKETKDLQKIWYKKIRELGFKDTESMQDISTNNINKQIIKVNFEQVRHFEACCTYLNSGEIKDKTSLIIFELYCEGRTTREIEVLIREQFKFQPPSQRTIHRTIWNILIDAKIKPYTFR